MNENMGLEKQNNKTELIKNSYENKLNEVIKLNIDFNNFLKKEDEYSRSGRWLEFQKQKLKLNNNLNGHLNDRVGLLHQNNISTVENEFPEIQVSKEYREDLIKTETMEIKLINLLESNTSVKEDFDALGDEARELMQNHAKDFTEDDIKLLHTTLLKIADKFGYKGRLITTDEDWLLLKKANVEIMLKYNALPIMFGAGGTRIQLIQIKRQKPNGDFENVCNYDKEWLEACEDLETQKEVDTLIAALG